MMLESSLLKQWVLFVLLKGLWMTGCLKDQKWLKDTCVIKAWKLEIQNALHKLQEAQQAEACPLWVAQLVWTFSRKLEWCLLFTYRSVSLSSPYYLYVVGEVGA